MTRRQVPDTLWKPGKVPRRGMHFLHARVLDPVSRAEQEYVVTRVAQGIVYYRPVYRDNDAIGEAWIGGSEYTEMASFERYALPI